MPPTFSDLVFWTSVAICAVAQVAILRSVFGASASAPASPKAPAGVPRPRRAVEVVWAVVPAVALAVLFAFTWRAIHPPPPAGSAPPQLHTALPASPATTPDAGVTTRIATPLSGGGSSA